MIIINEFKYCIFILVTLHVLDYFVQEQVHQVQFRIHQDLWIVVQLGCQDQRHRVVLPNQKLAIYVQQVMIQMTPFD